MELKLKSTGMRTFVIVWLGQVVSLMGTGMTRFAITIWAWEETGEASALALVGFFAFAPTVLFSPIAGALVDRWNRRLVMMVSDLAAALSVLVLLLLALTDMLQIWHLYIAGAFTATFEAFQFPAYSASVTTMLPKDQYARASGMLSMAQSASSIGAPVLASILLVTIGLSGILIIDVLTALVAIGTLLVVHIPQPEASEVGQVSRGSLWSESLFGFRYIFAQPSLLGLQTIFFFGNFIGGLSFAVIPAYILASTDNNELILGSVQSMFGIGGVVGGLLLSVWGGPRRKIHGVLLGHFFLGVFGKVLLGLGRTVPVWMAAQFCFGLLIPVLNGSNQAIWQAKVAPDVQGRVFAARRLIAQVAGPISMLFGGFLIDSYFEPAMQPDGILAPIFGGFFGTSPGSGMALLFVITGLLNSLVGLVGYAFRSVREVETILPDHESVVAT